jgi:hypothetical protein
VFVRKYPYCMRGFDLNPFPPLFPFLIFDLNPFPLLFLSFFITHTHTLTPQG